MTWINNITDDANQSMTLKLPSGDLIAFNLKYLESRQGWFYGIAYGTFSLVNRRVVTGLNMLRGFRNLLPFGFACTTSDGYEPILKTDFSSGRAKFFLLNENDVSNVEQMLVQAQQESA